MEYITCVSGSSHREVAFNSISLVLTVNVVVAVVIAAAICLH